MPLTLHIVAAASAQAACPTTDASYNNQRTGSINAGLYEVRWRITGITDAPCSKVRTIDQTATQPNCIEVTFDWDVGNAGHYDSRNYVNCHQNFWEQRVISEQTANEANDPPFGAGWQAIISMKWLAISFRSHTRSNTLRTDSGRLGKERLLRDADRNLFNLRRLLVAAGSLGIGFAGVAFVVSSFNAGGIPPGSGETVAPSDVVTVTCEGGHTKITDPQVNTRPDGLHVSMDADFDQPILTIFFEEGRVSHGLGPDFPFRSDAFVLPIPPGEAVFECGKTEADEPSAEGVTVDVNDPDGVWHDSSLACGGDFNDWTPAKVPFYYTDDNTFPDVIYATLPGLYADDEVDFAGYRDAEGRQFRIVREGEVVGLFDLSTYDQRTFVTYGAFCASSGIGDDDAGLLGMSSTPFDFPDYAECDPYASSCSSIWTSASRYEEFTGTTPALVPPAPWAACDAQSPDGCVPDAKDMVVRIVTTPEDAVKFVDTYGCGGTEQTACI